MDIDCYRVQFPKNMDANEYALKVQPAAKSLGIVLNKAAWLGKGQQPTVAVIEPQITEPKPEPAVEEEKPETAAKEKILEPDEATTQESTTATEVLPLAAESVEPIQETALPIGALAHHRGTRRSQRRRNHDPSGRPALPCAGPGEEHEL